MILEIFSVYDSKAKTWNNPIFTDNIATAKRLFYNSVNMEESTFWKNPEDYTLFHIGTFDSETGTITALEAKDSLGLALDYLGENK